MAKVRAKDRVVKCPQCGAEVTIGYMGGRKPLNLDVHLVCDTLRDTRSVGDTANELGCSRGSIYRELKKAGLTPKEVIDGGKTG